MTAYALAHLRRNPAPVHPDVLDYLESIQATLDPHDGHFLVHGGDVDVREGDWAGDLVLIQFPDISSARAWYDSPSYQKIKHLRSNHLDGDVILAHGVTPGHDPAQLASQLRVLAGGQHE